MASNAFTTKAAHKEPHYHVKQAFDPSVLGYSKLTQLELWELKQTKVGRIVGTHYSLINRGQGVHNAIGLI